MKKSKNYTVFTEGDAKILSRTRIHSKTRKSYKGRRKPKIEDEIVAAKLKAETAKNEQLKERALENVKKLEEIEYNKLIDDFIFSLRAPCKNKKEFEKPEYLEDSEEEVEGQQEEEEELDLDLKEFMQKERMSRHWRMYFRCPSCTERYAKWSEHVEASPSCEEF